jgi:hypothetical protein
MAKGKDERDNVKRRPKRNPIVVRDINEPNVLWVNFATPEHPHLSVLEYAENLRRQKGMSAHPSSQPKEEE